MLEKRKFEGFFSLNSKSFIKYWRQLTILATCLAQELLTHIQCSGGSRNSAEEMSASKLGSIVDKPLEVDNDQLRAFIKADALTII